MDIQMGSDYPTHLFTLENNFKAFFIEMKK